MAKRKAKKNKTRIEGVPEELSLGDSTAPRAQADERDETLDDAPAGTTTESKSGPGTGNAIDYVSADFVPIQCPRCKSEKREPFKGRTRRVETGRRRHEMLNKDYNVVIFRPTQCSDCGQNIMSREFKLEE